MKMKRKVITLEVETIATNAEIKKYFNSFNPNVAIDKALRVRQVQVNNIGAPERMPKNIKKALSR